MVTGPGAAVVRDAVAADVEAIRRFGESHVAAHYEPLIGAQAAADQVTRWWARDYLAAAVERGQVVVAEADGDVVGVGQRGRSGEEHVIYKLYVHPGLRGAGMGPRLVAAMVARLPTGADRLWVEHVAANERAAAFYEREGFTVERVEPSPSGDPRLAQVWRARRLGAGGGVWTSTR